MFNQGNKLYLISLSILTTCLLYHVWMLLGEVTWQSPLEVKGLTNMHVCVYVIGLSYNSLD